MPIILTVGIVKECLRKNGKEKWEIEKNLTQAEELNLIRKRRGEFIYTSDEIDIEPLELLINPTLISEMVKNWSKYYHI